MSNRKYVLVMLMSVRLSREERVRGLQKLREALIWSNNKSESGCWWNGSGSPWRPSLCFQPTSPSITSDRAMKCSLSSCGLFGSPHLVKIVHNSSSRSILILAVYVSSSLTLQLPMLVPRSLNRSSNLLFIFPHLISSALSSGCLTVFEPTSYSHKY